MKNTCGKCMYFLPHRRDKKGFEGRCKEIIVRLELTNILETINLKKEDEACNIFTLKTTENQDI